MASTDYLKSIYSCMVADLERARPVAHELVRDDVLKPSALDNLVKLKQALFWCEQDCIQADIAEAKRKRPISASEVGLAVCENPESSFHGQWAEHYHYSRLPPGWRWLTQDEIEEGIKEERL